MLIYKVITSDEWKSANAEGVFRGSPIDVQDGFIHLSAAEQVVETVGKYFAGKSNLVLLSIDADAVGETLRWETSRGGALFPHIYGVLSLDTVRAARPLPLGTDGTHDFPDFEEAN